FLPSRSDIQILNRATCHSDCHKATSQVSLFLSPGLADRRIGNRSLVCRAFSSVDASTYNGVALESSSHAAEEKVGVLLLNLGGPETLDDVQPFLFNMFVDPDIIRLPRLFRFLQRPLAKLISTLRAPKSKEGETPSTPTSIPSYSLQTTTLLISPSLPVPNPSFRLSHTSSSFLPREPKRCDGCFRTTNLSKCSRCQVVWYCGTPCQKSAWRLHRFECEALSRLDDHKRKSVTLSIRLMLKLYLRRKLQNDKIIPSTAMGNYKLVDALVAHMSDVTEEHLVLYAQMANLVPLILQWPEINIKEIYRKFFTSLHVMHIPFVTLYRDSGKHCDSTEGSQRAATPLNQSPALVLVPGPLDQNLWQSSAKTILHYGSTPPLVRWKTQSPPNQRTPFRRNSRSFHQTHDLLSQDRRSTFDCTRPPQAHSTELQTPDQMATSQVSLFLSPGLADRRIGNRSLVCRAFSSVDASTYNGVALESSSHAAEEKVGVLLLNLGGPETLDDVQPFLFNMFVDPDIIRLPRLFRFLQRPLAKLISTLRAPKSKEGETPSTPTSIPSYSLQTTTLLISPSLPVPNPSFRLSHTSSSFLPREPKRCDGCFRTTNLSKCSRCQVVWYCGTPCQKSAWRLHRFECEALSRLDDHKRKSVTLSIRLMLKLYLRRKLQNDKIIPSTAMGNYKLVDALVAHMSDVTEEHLVLYAQMANLVPLILQWPEINIKEIYRKFFTSLHVMHIPFVTDRRSTFDCTRPPQAHSTELQTPDQMVSTIFSMLFSDFADNLVLLVM
ncbi:hypothetical protein RYX36_006523, partial [Vicia faba]